MFNSKSHYLLEALLPSQIIHYAIHVYSLKNFVTLTADETLAEYVKNCLAKKSYFEA